MNEDEVWHLGMSIYPPSVFSKDAKGKITAKYTIHLGTTQPNVPKDPGTSCGVSFRASSVRTLLPS